MYKGTMLGVFSEPILAIKEDCSIEEMSEAMLKSIEILHENKDKIAEESNRIKYGDLLSLRFKKLNKVGIRASKKKIAEVGSILMKQESENRTYFRCQKIDRYHYKQYSKKKPALLQYAYK